MTATVRVLAPAKINLHLEVLGLRADGFHELAMVMQSIDLADELICDNTADGQIHLSCDVEGLSTGGDNLITRAAELLRSRSGFNELGASIQLNKKIPIGAGQAGGSSDGAAAMDALNIICGLGHAPADLEVMAAELGSDMPFCIRGGTQLCFGRGEQLEPCPAPDQAMGIVLVKDPSVGVSPWAYGECRSQRGATYLEGEAATGAPPRSAGGHQPLRARQPLHCRTISRRWWRRRRPRCALPSLCWKPFQASCGLR